MEYSGNVLVVHLKGLNVEDAYELLRSRGAKISVEDFLNVYRITIGHPLALTLIARVLGRKSEVKVSSDFFDFLFNEVYAELSDEEKLMPKSSLFLTIPLNTLL